jgi:hypothetical protein
MWLFTKHGFVDLVQHPHPDHADELMVRTQVEDDMSAFVRLLDEASGVAHTVRPAVDGDYRFVTSAAKATVAGVVARLVANIDYRTFKQAVHFDLGRDNTYVVMLGPHDLQVAKLLKDDTATAQ